MSATSTPIVEIRNVHKSFGALKALNNVSLSMNLGEKVVIIGPSGSGKSTLLRSINKLETVDSGTIIVDGHNIMDPNTNINKLRMELGMVFQSFNLFPHKTVLENLTLAPIKLKGMPKDEANSIALKLLDKVGIKEKAHVYPSKLSGGQQQRVAMPAPWPCRPKSCCLTSPPAPWTPR